MNRTTVIMLVLALASLGGAWSMRPQDLKQANFEDTGEPLFKQFTDPTLATALDVVAWDEDGASVLRFAVAQKEGRWVIPSHNDYPADGTERMAKAASSFIDVKKDRYFGDNPADHASFGVLDPEGDEGKGDEKGQRITIKDAAGTVLVDVIVGKAVPEHQGYFYVRYPAEKRVYGSELELDISTDFADWIDKDLLHVERDEFVEMIYNPYTFDEAENMPVGDDQPVVAEVDPDEPNGWKLVEGAPAPMGKIVDSMKVRQMLTSLASLKIVGVRPRPPARSMLEAQLTLAPKGFFVVPADNGAPILFGNEGSLQGITKDGLVVSVFFGEVTYESGIALTAGAAKDEEGSSEPPPVMPTEEGEGEGDDTKKTASRYIFVNVAYNPQLDKSDGLPPEPEPEEGDEKKKKDEKPKLTGEQRAQQLAGRFDEWFYVISDASFQQIHKNRDELFKDAPAPDPSEGPDGLLHGETFDGPPGMPGALGPAPGDAPTPGTAPSPPPEGDKPATPTPAAPTGKKPATPAPKKPAAPAGNKPPAPPAEGKAPAEPATPPVP